MVNFLKKLLFSSFSYQAFPAILCTIGHFSPRCGVLTIFSYVFFFRLASNKVFRKKSSILIQYIFFYFSFLWIEGWVLQLTLPGWVFLNLYLAIWPVLWFWLIWKLDGFSEWIRIIFAAVIWVGLEWWRGTFVFDGYMFNFAAVSMVADFPILYQTADLLGVWLPSILLLVIAGLHSSNSLQKWRFSISIPLIVFMFGYGFLSMNSSYDLRTGSYADLPPDHFGPPIRVLQTDLQMGIKERVTPAQQRENVEYWMEVSNAFELSEVKPSLVVWPETMLPGVGFNSTVIKKIKELPDGWSYLIYPQQFLKSVAQVNQISYLVGTLTWSDFQKNFDNNTIAPEGRRNSATLVYSDGSTKSYHKRALAPFGEKLPFIERFDFLVNLFKKFAPEGFSFQLIPGDLETVFSLEHQGRKVYFATPICFEGTVPQIVRNLVYQSGEKHCDFLINISNDGWFGRNSPQAGWLEKLHARSARHRHLLTSILRTVENRVPMIRAVNTGPSVLIDANGVVSEKAVYTKVSSEKATFLQNRLEGTLRMDVIPVFDSRISLYSVAGDLLGAICGVFSGFWFLWCVARLGARSM